MRNLEISTDWHGQLPPEYGGSDGKSNPDTAFVNLGDHPGSELFNQFKHTYYDIFNLAHEYAGRMEQIPDELIRQLDSQIEAWVELNRQSNNLVLLGKKELIASLVQDENNQPYSHFGAYRKTFALPLQERLFNNCLDLMNQMVGFYQKSDFQEKIVMDGNVDAGFFNAFDQRITKNYNAKQILTANVDHYVDSLSVLSRENFILALLPFYQTIGADENTARSFIDCILQQKKSSNRPLLLAMHGQPSQIAHGEIPLSGDHLHHVTASSRIIENLAGEIDLMMYGHLHSPIVDNESGIYGLNINGTTIPTKYLREREVFAFSLDDLPEIKQLSHEQEHHG